MSALGHSRPSYFVPALNNVRYASDSGAATVTLVLIILTQIG
jgi:hypothetical protein